MTLARSISLLLLVSCTAGSGDTAGTASTCGDPDGFGTDTGDLPNMLGNWTTATFATSYYDDDCSTDNLDAESEDWIGAFEIDGRAPDALYLQFLNAPERFWGAMDQNGGITFSAAHAHSAGTLYVQLGGLVYHDKYQDRDTIDGFAFLGLDTDNDGTIDCRGKADWKAYKSGF